MHSMRNKWGKMEALVLRTTTSTASERLGRMSSISAGREGHKLLRKDRQNRCCI